MQNNQITQDDKQSQPGNGEKEENVQSISSQESTPGQQTAFCDLSTRQENEFLSNDTSIRRFIKTSSGSRQTTAAANEPDPNNNGTESRQIDAIKKIQSIEHQPVHRSFSMEPPAPAPNSSNLPEQLLAENTIQQQSSAAQTQSNSLPTIRLSSETDLNQAIVNQLQDKLNYRKSSDSTHKRSRLTTTKKTARNVLLTNKEKSDGDAKVIRTHSFNSPKQSLKKYHHHRHNQTSVANKTSSRSSSIESNLHIQASCLAQTTERQLEKQFERHFEKRARKDASSRCKHRHHHPRKSSARQLIYSTNTASSTSYSPQPGNLSHNYSRSSEDIRTCNCSSERLAPTVYLSNNGALVYHNGCFSSTSALVPDSSTSPTSGLKLHHSPINVTNVTNAPIVPTSFLLLPDGTVCKTHHNISLSPTYLSSYSAVPSYSTTPVHGRHKQRASSKGSRSSKRLAVSPIPSGIPPSAIEHLALDSIENRLTKSNSVRLSRGDSSKSKCTKDHLCRKCRRKTSLNSTLRGQQNYAEFADSGKHFGGHLTPSSTAAQPIHLNLPSADQLASTTSPLLLHNPLHLHPAAAVVQCTAHEPITKTTSLNPAALGHIVSPVHHLCQFNDAAFLATNNLTAQANTPNKTSLPNPILSQLSATPSTLSVPDLSRLAQLNVTSASAQPINLQCAHMHPFQNVQSNLEQEANTAVSAAFTKLYRNKPAPEYFKNLFSASRAGSPDLDKPKLIDYLLTGAEDLSKFLSKSSQLDTESPSLDKNLKADANRKSSSTESLNLKVSATTNVSTTTPNDKQPIKRSLFKDKLAQTKVTETDKDDKHEDKVKDKSLDDAGEANKENDRMPADQPSIEKRKTFNRNPMLNLLRKAQQTAEADAPPPTFEPNKSLEQSEPDRSKDEVKADEKVKVNTDKLVAQRSIEQVALTSDRLANGDIIQSEKVNVDEKANQQAAAVPSKRPFLMRMLASKKGAKQLPITSKSLEHPTSNGKKNKQVEHHTIDIPQTQEEISESVDELHALRTNLRKSGSVTNGSKSALPCSSSITNILRRSSLSKEESTTTSTMSKLRKKVSQALC